MKDDWTYRRPTRNEVLERVLAGAGGLVFTLAMYLGPEWSAAGVLTRVVLVVSSVAAVAGIGLGIANRRGRKAASAASA